MMEVTDKFTNHLKTVLTRALCLVVEQNGKTIEPNHLLWAIGTEDGSIGGEIIKKAGISENHLRTFANAFATVSNTPKKTPAATPLLSTASKNAIEKAVLTATMFEYRYVGTEHLLSGLLQLQKQDLRDFLHSQGIPEKSILNALNNILRTTASFLERQKTSPYDPPPVMTELEGALDDEPTTSALEYFGVELTTKQMAEKFDPLIGREVEVNRLASVLLRKNKNNPLLLGDAGVGKTAIVEGLAKMIVNGKVANALLNKRIFRLDLVNLVAGTTYRGDFENRIQEILEELAAQPNIILFIDEIHNLVGAGSSSSNNDASNMLKPALARGQIRCIGATTWSEFKRHIEPDAALERRFQTINVKEPSLAETRLIINGLRTKYEAYHHVKFTKAAIDTTLKLAERYLHGKQFPDKAVDILDEAGAAAMLTNTTASAAIKRRSLEEALTLARVNKASAVMSEQFLTASNYKKQEDSLNLEYSKLNNKDLTTPIKTIDHEDILRAVSHLTGISLTTLGTNQTTALKNLESRLQTQVVGQTNATSRVSQALKRAKLGLNRPNRPLASFLFVGPSGVGKTELARAIAHNFFDDQTAFIRLDMSEFAESYAVSKLLGSPAGYVGFREGAKLTDAVHAKPHSVILFDELEKAHSDVHNLLLQLLDEGLLTDATGKQVSFRNTVVIMTTNAGTARFSQANLGFSDSSQIVDQKLEADIRTLLEDSFRPEFLNRIDHTCLFRPLDQNDLTTIATIALENLKERLSEQNFSISFNKKIAPFIASRVSQKQGARDIRRLVEELIEHPLTDLILNKPNTHDFHIDLDKKGSGLEFGIHQKLKTKK
jgi:ATP-dependent Clp protease ATP-binding subunit ClpC